MRRKKSSVWHVSREKDSFHRRAREEGYRSRSAFKLKEIVEKKNIIRRGDVVVDLGASPGGWLQIAREKAGEEGLLIGVDIKPIRLLPHSNIKYLLTSIYNGDVEDILLKLAGKPVDVVLSDVSPNIVGAWEVDRARQIDLANRALTIASRILRRNGCFLTKVFQGPEVNAFYRGVKESFHTARYEKPRASRPRSSEMYILGIGFNGVPL